MKYENIKNLNNEEFKRLTGVSYQTFLDMVKVVKDFVLINKKTGRKNKLSIEDQILLTLAYYKELN